MNESIEIPPDAAALIESMRDIGYTLETALADIVDNSITAGARNVGIRVDPSHDQFSVAVIDDGIGMSRAELLLAMKPGSANPRDLRDADDLGRFGLGMKTASFSQCRRVTVYSKRDGVDTAAIWDLDDVAKANKWIVTVLDAPAEVLYSDLVAENGTVVVWQKLDRLVDDEASDDARRHFTRRLDEARQHLELVFHRYLAPERSERKVAIELNGTSLKAFDPFHKKHLATQHGPAETIRVGGHDVHVQPFTLPHHDKVDRKDWEYFAGPQGYLRSQGFYVYRGRRLIIHSTWFGLARQTELTKLARVQIDMPNDLDAIWKIDVLKASAQPPRQVRDRLRALLEGIAGGSKRTYTKRGAKLTTESRLPLWNRVQDHGSIRYRVNDEHPAIATFESNLGDGMIADFRKVMELVAASVPTDAIIADRSGSPHDDASAILPADALRYAVETVYDQLRATGLEVDDIREVLRVTEPFRANFDSSSTVLDELVLNLENT